MPTVILTNSFPTPSCRYTLHVNSIDGPEAQFTRIGDSVFHRWTCDSTMYVYDIITYSILTHFSSSKGMVSRLEVALLMMVGKEGIS